MPTPAPPTDRSPLRRAREARGWSLAELAALTRRTKAHLSRVERGQRIPSADLRIQLSRLLRQPIDVLFPDDAGSAQ